MCSRNRAARRAARRGCGNYGRCSRNGYVHQPRQSLIRKIVNHIIESREQKQALARGEFVQPRALEQRKQEMRVEREGQQNELVDEKQKLRIEDLGMSVDGVGRGSLELPTYREALKEV